MEWWRAVLVAVDQLGNAIVGGESDETLSAHAWRMEQQLKPWGITRRWIDWLFGEGHCERAFVAECERRQSPEEER